MFQGWFQALSNLLFEWCPANHLPSGWTLLSFLSYSIKSLYIKAKKRSQLWPPFSFSTARNVSSQLLLYLFLMFLTTAKVLAQTAVTFGLEHKRASPSLTSLTHLLSSILHTSLSQTMPLSISQSELLEHKTSSLSLSLKIFQKFTNGIWIKNDPTL